MIFFLTIKSLGQRKLSAFLCVLSIALSVALYLGVSRVKQQAENSFMSTVSGVDLLVGARSGEINLILYSLFHMGSPLNNIRYESYQQIKQMREVAWTIPISLGDSYHGFRVIGTEQTIFDHYKYGDKQPLTFRKGAGFKGLFEVVLGNEVAIAEGLQIGDEIYLAHGAVHESMLEHDNISFKITGILNQTGTPMDRAVLTSLEAIEAIHIGWETGAPTDVPEQAQIQPEQLKPQAITSFLIATKSKFQLLRLRHKLAQFPGEPLSAIIPGLALSKLWNLLADVEKSLLVISLCVLIVGIFSIIVSLVNTLQARKKEIAVLRAIGASPRHIAGLFLVEGPVLTSIGIIFGIILLAGIQIVMFPVLAQEYQFQLDFKLVYSYELPSIILFFGAGLFSGILPGLLAYKGSLQESF
jgi:putative ABC transport system permease protein